MLVAAAVTRAAWKELVMGDIAAELGSPEELCFYRCVETVTNIIRLRKPGVGTERLHLLGKGVTEATPDRPRDVEGE
jgi:hypothetical protein